MPAECAETYCWQNVRRRSHVCGAAGRCSVANRPGGWDAGAPGLPASPTPTSVIRCVSCIGRVAVGTLGCLGRVAVRILGVVPSGFSALCRLDSRRMAWPHLCTLGWSSGDSRWNGLQSTGSLPHTCSQPPVVPRVPSPRGVAIAFLAGSHGASSLPLVALSHGG